MPGDPRKRQKKLQRQTARRKEKKHDQVREESRGLPERMAAATLLPVLHCWIPDSIAEQGIGWVVLSRAFPNGLVAVSSFLVDSYCLGVKFAVAEIVPRLTYETKYVRKRMADMPSSEVSPSEARKLIEGAVAYARGLGFSPHSDYSTAMLLFGDVDSADSTATFVYGKDGKPYFINGPRESASRCKEIIAILTKTCGPGNFHFLMQVDPEAMKQGELRLVDPTASSHEDSDEAQPPSDRR